MNEFAYDNELFEWDYDEMLEIELPDPDSFLKIKETLTRIGVFSKKTNTLIQSVHILFKQQKYYLVSFKEVFLLDRKGADVTYDDIERRNAIADLLKQWGLLSINWKDDQYKEMTDLSRIKVIPFSEKQQYNLVSKVTVGKIRKA